MFDKYETNILSLNMVIPFIIDLYSAIYSLPIKVFKFVSILVNSIISSSKSFFFEKTFYFREIL